MVVLCESHSILWQHVSAKLFLLQAINMKPIKYCMLLYYMVQTTQTSIVELNQYSCGTRFSFIIDEHLNMEKVTMLKTPTCYLCNIRVFCCPETSVRNYHYTLRNSPEECSSLSWSCSYFLLAIPSQFLLNSHFRPLVDQLNSAASTRCLN